MSNVEISESDHLKSIHYNEDNEIGETYEDKGYSKIPLDQINLNTEPITISNDFSYPLFDTNIKSYIKFFLGFIVFIIILFIITILSGHFHYEKDETNQYEIIKDNNLNKKMIIKQEVDLNKTPIEFSKNITINETIINNNTNNNPVENNNQR